MPCPRGVCARFLERVLTRQKGNFLDRHRNRAGIYHSRHLISHIILDVSFNNQAQRECQAEALRQYYSLSADRAR